MNERELRILQRITDSLRAIQQDIHAIYEKGRPDGDQEQPPTLVDIQSAIRLPPAVNDYYESENTEGPKDRRRDRVRLLLESIALGAAILAAIFTFRALHQAQRQADAAQGQLDLIREQNRPWLKIEDIRFPKFDDAKAPLLSFFQLPAPQPMSGLSLQIEFRIRNIGNAVAQNIYINPKIVFESERSPLNLTGGSEAKLCSGPRDDRPPVGPPFYRSAVFPGDEFKSNYGTFLPFRADEITHVKGRTGDFLIASLVGCVGYQYPQTYQTIAIFHVIGPKDQFIEVNKTLHFNEVHLQREAPYDYAQ